MRFAGKTALVTGASRGIGAATARQLAREGADVVVHYAQAALKAEAVCEEIRALGRQAWAVQVDVADREAVNPMVRDVLERVGQLDLLVNNAAEVGACSFDELTPEHWDRMIQVNLTGVYNMLWAFKDHFCARGSGSIVNVSSVAATAVRPNIMPYAAAKAGVISLTKSCCEPLARHNVRINCVAPGVTETDMLREMSEAEIAVITAATPIGRVAAPEEMAQVICFLLSEEASYLIGATIIVSGGRQLIP